MPALACGVVSSEVDSQLPSQSRLICRDGQSSHQMLVSRLLGGQGLSVFLLPRHLLPGASSSVSLTGSSCQLLHLPEHLALQLSRPLRQPGVFHDYPCTCRREVSQSRLTCRDGQALHSNAGLPTARVARPRLRPPSASPAGAACPLCPLPGTSSPIPLSDSSSDCLAM